MVLVFSATLFACTAATYYGPPRVHFRGPPHLHHIPGSYIYVVADMDVGIFFYDGYWYRNYNNFWFRARFYNGSWMKIVIGNVPPRLHRLPGSWRQHLRRDAYRIPHRDLKQHYKRWERERYWDKDRGREQRKMKKKYKERKHEYRKEQRRHGSELREPERHEPSVGTRPAERVEDRRERTEDRREHVEERRERVREDKAHGIARPAKDKGKPHIVKETSKDARPKKAEVKETKQPARPEKADVKGKSKEAKKKVVSKEKAKGKKKGKKKQGEGDEEQDEDGDGDDDGRGKGSRPR